MRTKFEILDGMPLPVFLINCKSDFKFFCERCLGITTYGGIHDFQLQWFKAAIKFKRLIIEAGAGSSKTEIMGAAYPLWRMFCENDLKILLISKTLEQSSSNILSRIKKYIEDNELLTDYFVPQDFKSSWNATEIKTKNGHWVKNAPLTDSIRGFRADLIIADEIDSYDKVNIFFEHVLARLYPDAQLIGISTPTGPTRIIGQLKERYKAGILKGWHFIKTPYLVDNEGNPAVIENREDILNYKSVWPEWWSVQKLYDRWAEQGKANWMRNYMCENVREIDDALFPMKNIVSAFDYNRGFDYTINQDAMYFIGADFAISEGPRADFDAYTVIEKKNDQYIIKHIETHKGWQRPEKVNRLQELFNQFNSSAGTFLVVDESNMGTMVMNDLRNRGIPVLGQKFHTAARKNLIINLSTVFAGKGIVIPRSPDSKDDCIKYSELLKEQLIGFKRKKSEKTGDELIESTASHDDVAISLAMAINEAVKHDSIDCLPISE